MFKVENLNKPSNKKWKMIADVMLYALPFLSTAILTIPLSDNAQKWILFGVNVVIIVFKAISKFTTDEVESNS